VATEEGDIHRSERGGIDASTGINKMGFCWAKVNNSVYRMLKYKCGSGVMASLILGAPPALARIHPATRHSPFDPKRRTQVSRRGRGERMKAGVRTPPRAVGWVVRARSEVLGGRGPATSRSPESPMAV
jgi:hypothetical protein